MKLSVKVELSTDAKNKLSAISESISKDVAEMQVANQLGVNAMDPSVKEVVNKNSSQTSSTASSSITNISNKTTVTTNNNSDIIITAPGEIIITGSTIDSNTVSNIVVEQMMKQAVANGLDIASKTLSDNKDVLGVINKVKGLDDATEALGQALKAGTDNTLPPPPTSGLTNIMYIAAIIGGVMVLGMVFKMMGSKSSSPPPLSRFRSLVEHKMKYRMMGEGDNYIIGLIAITIIFPLLIVGLVFYLKKR